MQLTEPQSRALLAKHGVYVTEVCNGCGRILGHVRFARFGQPGEWCSRECRDGSAAAEHHAATRKVQLDLGRETRKGGRPKKYGSDRERQIAKRQQDAIAQRAHRKRLSVRKNPPVSDSFHVSTGAENRPLAIGIAGERV